MFPTSVLQVHPRTLVSLANHMKHGKQFLLPHIRSAVLSARCSFKNKFKDNLNRQLFIDGAFCLLQRDSIAFWLNQCQAAGSCRLKWFSVAYRPWNLLRTALFFNVNFKMLRLYGRRRCRRTGQGVSAGGECVLQQKSYTYFGDKLGLMHFHIMG